MCMGHTPGLAHDYHRANFDTLSAYKWMPGKTSTGSTLIYKKLQKNEEAKNKGLQQVKKRYKTLTTDE